MTSLGTSSSIVSFESTTVSEREFNVDIQTFPKMFGRFASKKKKEQEASETGRFCIPYTVWDNFDQTVYLNTTPITLLHNWILGIHFKMTTIIRV